MTLGSVDLLVRALEHAGVRYLVAGGLAVNAHGYLRFTRDVDLVLQLTPIDVFVAEPFPFDEEYARALVKPLGAIPVRFVSIPSLIRMKEIADRPQDRIDIEYLRKLADASR